VVERKIFAPAGRSSNYRFVPKDNIVRTILSMTIRRAEHIQSGEYSLMYEDDNGDFRMTIEPGGAYSAKACSLFIA